MGVKRFRIAFSFAGEKRHFVEKVAGSLVQNFGKEAILYDKFHEAEFSRARLGRYLPKIYNEQSDLVVVVICRDYAAKEWCGLEWDAIFDLLRQRREGEVMLSRFDYATVDGLFSDAGFIELDHKTPEQFSALILERLALNEGKPRDYYTTPPSEGGKVSRTSISNKLTLGDLLRRSIPAARKRWRVAALYLGAAVCLYLVGLSTCWLIPNDQLVANILVVPQSASGEFEKRSAKADSFFEHFARGQSYAQPARSRLEIVVGILATYK